MLVCLGGTGRLPVLRIMVRADRFGFFSLVGNGTVLITVIGFWIVLVTEKEAEN